MSVIKAMRGESTMQFVDTARKLEAHTFSVVTKAPKRYGPYLLYKLMALATRFMTRFGQRTISIRRTRMRLRCAGTA